MRKKLKNITINFLKNLLERLGVRTIERDGVFTVIRHPENQDMILLVKHGYGTKKWSLPGGGLKQAELALDGAIREVFDETGLLVRIKKQIAYLSLEQKYGFTSLFEGEVVKGSIHRNGDGQEILACNYFHKDYLPEMYNAQRGMIGWSEYHKGGDPVLYGHPNKPPIKKFST